MLTKTVATRSLLQNHLPYARRSYKTYQERKCFRNCSTSTTSVYGLYIKPKKTDKVTLTYTLVTENYANAYKTSSFDPKEYDKILKNNCKKEFLEKFPGCQNDLPLRKMRDSFTIATLHPSEAVETRADHGGPFTGTKARLINFADVMAAWIAGKHMDIPGFDKNSGTHEIRNPCMTVTGLIDQFWVSTNYDFENKPDSLIRAAGHVVWTGKSKMEVHISMDQQDKSDHWNQWVQIATTSFIMYTRRPDGKPTFVNKLIGENRNEDNFIERRQKRHWRRKLFTNDTSQEKFPSPKEISVLAHIDHDNRLAHPTKSSIKSTEVLSNYPCSQQSRNNYYAAFGGYIMNCGEQAGIKAAQKFSKSNPKLYQMGHIRFLKGIPIGKNFRCTAMVTVFDAKKNLLHVPVIGETHDPSSKTRDKHSVVSVFHCVFKLPDGIPAHVIPAIVPATPEEKMLRLNGLRYLRFIHEPERMYNNPNATVIQ